MMSKSPREIHKFTIDDEENSWMQVAGQPAFVGYSADEPDGFTLGMGFGLIQPGTAFEFLFAYDEVIVVTKGSLIVQDHDQDLELTIHRGELVFVPPGVPGVVSADEECEVVFVHYPTSDRATREWAGPAQLKPLDVEMLPTSAPPQ